MQETVRMQAGVGDVFTLLFAPRLPGQHRPAVYVEDFSADEPGVFGTQKQHWSRNLLWTADTAQWDRIPNLVSDLRVRESAGAHVGIDPAGGDAVDVDARRSQL